MVSEPSIDERSNFLATSRSEAYEALKETFEWFARLTFVINCKITFHRIY